MKRAPVGMWITHSDTLEFRMSTKRYSRTLEEALQGVPPPYPTVKTRAKRRGVRKKTGYKRPPAQHTFTGRKQPTSWMLRIKPDHPEYCPELAKKHYLMTQANGRKGAAARVGLPEGYRRAEWNKIWAKRQQKAKVMVQKMKDTGVLDETRTKDDERAEVALEFATAVVLSPEYNVKERLNAARTLLDFTKKKPAAVQDVTVRTAEDFLAALATQD
jgi:hypothetical protein